VPKATSTPNGASTAADRKLKSAERKAAKLVEAARQEAASLLAAAEADAAGIRAEADEHARRLILDARASAEGVRAEGMEVVSELRQMGDALQAMGDRLLSDIESIYARMVGELERATPDGVAATAEPSEEREAQLDVPEFVSQH
jgi:cell division septum initiation protein DivIVA